MRTVALIPARGGSKGLPKKNIKDIFGKPLIAWSIIQALTAKLISDVFVSTNCHEIAGISKKFGASVPFIRPDNISDDTASTESAILHFCEYIDDAKIKVDNILLIQCTSPVRAHGRFDDAIKHFNRKKFDSMLSVANCHNFLWRNIENPEALYDFKNRPRRQDIPSVDQNLVETGSFYIFKKDKFMLSENRLCGNIGLYKTPTTEMFDIDTLSDFSICENLLSIHSEHDNFAA